jgi:hypothetical protein
MGLYILLRVQLQIAVEWALVRGYVFKLFFILNFTML